MLEAMLRDTQGHRLISTTEYTSLVEDSTVGSIAGEDVNLFCPLCEQPVVFRNVSTKIGAAGRFGHKYLNGTSSCCPNHDPQSWSSEGRENPLLSMRIKMREPGSYDFEIGFPKMKEEQVATLRDGCVKLNLGFCTYEINDLSLSSGDTVWLRYGMKPGAEPLYWNYEGTWSSDIKKPVFNDSYAPLMLFKCRDGHTQTADRVDKLHSEVQPNDICFITYTTSTIKSRQSNEPKSLDPCIDALIRDGLAKSCSHVGHICDTGKLIGVATISFDESAFKDRHLRLPVFQYFL